MVTYLGDIDLAEEAAADAFAVAAERWPRDGEPSNAMAWLLRTARNRAIDRIRRERTLAGKLRLLAHEPPIEDEIDEGAVPDDRLKLIFMCCHPALALDAQVALTLRALGGLSNDEISRAFLVPDETMKRRLSRARAKIKSAGIPFVIPTEDTLPERLAAVLAVIYLIYNEGYGGHGQLAPEAIRTLPRTGCAAPRGGGSAWAACAHAPSGGAPRCAHPRRGPHSPPRPGSLPLGRRDD